MNTRFDLRDCFFGCRCLMTKSLPTFWHCSASICIGIWPGPEHGDPESVGDGPGIGLNRNFPMPTGEGDAAYCFALVTYGLKDVETFKPDLIIVACGLDAMAGVPLAWLDFDHVLTRSLVGPTPTARTPCALSFEGAVGIAS